MSKELFDLCLQKGATGKEDYIPITAEEQTGWRKLNADVLLDTNPFSATYGLVHLTEGTWELF